MHNSLTQLKPADSVPLHKAPDASYLSDISHHRGSIHVDVSKNKRGSGDYNTMNLLANASSSRRRKSHFSGAEAGVQKEDSKKSTFARFLHAASTDLGAQAPGQSRVTRIMKFTKLRNMLAKNSKNTQNTAETLRNVIKQDLAARLKTQEKIPINFGEKITSMCMSSDGKFVIVATHYVESSPTKMKFDTIKTERGYSPLDIPSSPEDGPLLDQNQGMDASDQIMIKETLVLKSLNEDNINNSNNTQAPQETLMNSTKIKRPAVLWYFDIEKRIPEKLPLGEDNTDPEKEIPCMTITKDNRYVICGWSDGMIRAYDLVKHRHAFEFKDVHKSKTCCIAAVVISSDGKFLISGAYKDRSVSVFDLQKHSLKFMIKDIHKDWLKCLTISSDNQSIVAGFYDGTIKVIDREKKEVIHSFNINRDEKKSNSPIINMIGSLEVTHNGKYIVIGSQDRCIRVFDLKDGSLVHVYDFVHERTITTLIFSPDDRYAISGSFDGSVGIIDFEKREIIHIYKKLHQGQISCSLLSPDSKHILTGSHDGVLQIINLEKEELLGVIEKVHSSGVDTIAISQNDQYIISGSYDGSIVIHDLSSYRCLYCFKNAHSKGIKSVKITSDNQYIISGSDDCTIKIFGTDPWALLFTFNSIHRDWVTALALTTNDKFLVSGSRDCSIKIINLETHEVIHHYEKAHDKAITCLALTTNNKYIISGSEDKSIRVFSLRSFRRNRPIFVFDKAHEDYINCLTLTRDNKYIVSGSSDKSIKIFHFEKMECLHTISNAHSDIIKSVAISKDDKYIISGSNDKSIHIFDIEKRKKLYSLVNEHKDYISVVTVTSDNTCIVSGCNDNQIRIFTNPYNLTTLAVTESDRILPLSYFGIFILNRFLEEEARPDLQYRMILKYPHINIYPHAFNLFHIAAVFSPNKELFKFCLDSKIDFSGDFYGRTPLHYMLNSTKIDLNNVNYLLENFASVISTSSEPYKVMTDVTQDLPKILTLSPSLVENLLNAAVANPLSYNNEEITHFGSILGGGNRKSVPYKSPIFTPQIKSQLINEQDNRLLSIRILLLYMDYDLCSPEVLELAQVLESVDNEMVFKTKAISVFIDYIWQTSKKVLYVIGFIYSVFMMFLSYYSSQRDYEKEKWLETLLIVFGIILLCYKLLQLFANGIKVYFTDFWNFVEILVYIMVITTIGCTWKGSDKLTLQWLTTITLFLGYAKWVAFFRIISQTRKLIRIIIEILKDMRSFIAILIFAILGFSVIFFQFDDDTGYTQRLLLVYNLLYASFNIEDFNNSQIFYLIVVTILLPVVLLNMLIAIMSGTYERVQRSTVLTDSKEKIVLTLETIALKKFFKKIGGFLKRASKIKITRSKTTLFDDDSQESTKGYLFFVEEANSHMDENTSEFEWEGRMNAMKKIIRAEMQNEYEKVQSRITGLEGHITQHEAKLGGLRRSLGEKMNELEQNMGLLTKMALEQKSKIF